MKILYTVIFLLFANQIFAQYPVGDLRWNKVTGKNYVTDSSANLKLRNNYTEDSIPVTDMYGVWKMKRFFGDSSNVTNIYNIIDSSKTVNNYLSGIDSSSTRLLSGSVIWDSNFVFHNTLLKYLILGKAYTAAANTVTLNAADPTYDRYTVIYADIFGNVSFIDGVAGAFATIPQVDPTTQILLGIYYIPHASTKPAFVSNSTIYKENIEWVLSGTATGLDGNYPTLPYAGLKSTLVPVIITGQYLAYTNSTSLTASDYGYLIFYLKLGAIFSTTTNLILSFQNGGSPISTTLSLASGSFGFDRTVVGAYQLIAIPMSAIAFSSQNFNQLRIGLTGSNASGFQIDNIILQAGNIPPIPTASVVNSWNNQTGNVLPKRIDYKWYFDSSSISIDGRKIIHWNNMLPIDSVQYSNGPDTLMAGSGLQVVKKEISGSRYDTLLWLGAAGTGMQIVDSPVVVNGITLNYKVFRSTATGGTSQWTNISDGITYPNTIEGQGKFRLKMLTDSFKIETAPDALNTATTATYMKFPMYGRTFIKANALNLSQVASIESMPSFVTYSDGMSWGAASSTQTSINRYLTGIIYNTLGAGTHKWAKDNATILATLTGTSDFAIGASAPAASAQLDVQGTTKGILIPRLTTAQQNAIATPATGLQIFNTDLVSFMFYNGTAWVAVGGGGGISVIKQTHTSGITVTVSNTTTWLIVNPATILASLAVTLPASPTDGQDVLISFGGTITSGGVVTAISISPTPIDATTPGFVAAGEHIAYRWNATNSKWYRIN